MFGAMVSMNVDQGFGRFRVGVAGIKQSQDLEGKQ